MPPRVLSSRQHARDQAHVALEQASGDGLVTHLVAWFVGRSACGGKRVLKTAGSGIDASIAASADVK